MSQSLDPWDQALLEALEGNTRPGLLTLEELAARSELPLTLLEVVAREGFIRPVESEPEPRFDPKDLEPVRAGMALVEAGLPLGELLELARKVDAAMEPIADEAVELFARFVRDSVEVNAPDESEAARRLVSALTTMLPAAGRMVDHHFRSLLVERARARLRPPGPSQ